MNGKTYGYIRVSTKEHHTGRQMVAMEAFGLKRTQIYVDKCYGKNFERPQYQRMLRRLRPGDILVVKSIDRMGRNYEDIRDQ